MSRFITESPTGSIDGSNKEYFTGEIATFFGFVKKDGVETLAYTYDSGTKKITFIDAPLYSVDVLYLFGVGFALNEDEVLLKEENKTLNGTNTYTVSQEIKELLYVEYDGVSTTDYSVSGSNINFGSIPQTSVNLILYVGYASDLSGGDLTDNSNQTALINRLYLDILKEKLTSSVFRLTTAKEIFNEVQDAVCTGSMIAFNGERIKAPHLKFLDIKKYLTYYVPYSVETEFTTQSTQIRVTGNVAPESGYIYVKGNVIKYNSRTIVDGVITFMGLTNLNTTGIVSDSVSIVYELPNDYLKDFKLSYFRDTQEHSIELQDQRISSQRLSLNYTKVTDYNKDFLVVTSNSILDDQETLVLSYYKRPLDMSTTVNSILPDKYAMSILPYLVASRMQIVAGEKDSAYSNQLLGLAELKRMYSEYGEPGSKFRQKIRTQNYVNQRFFPVVQSNNINQ